MSYSSGISTPASWRAECSPRWLISQTPASSSSTCTPNDDDVVEVEAVRGQRLGREQPFGGELGLLGPERAQADGADIVDMADHEHRRQMRRIGLAGRAFGVAQAGEFRAVRAAVLRPRLGARLQRARKFGRIIVGMAFPLRVVVARHQPAAVDRHQLRQMLVHARAVQALVEVFPENLPVAVHDLGEAVTRHQFLERPVAEIAGGRVEARSRACAGRGVEIDEDEAAPFRERHRIERVVLPVEAFRQRSWTAPAPARRAANRTRHGRGR